MIATIEVIDTATRDGDHLRQWIVRSHGDVCTVVIVHRGSLHSVIQTAPHHSGAHLTAVIEALREADEWMREQQERAELAADVRFERTEA